MEKLYHYTDANGLLGILKKNQIWLTNIQFLNDSNEFEEGEEYITQAIEEEIKFIEANPYPPPEGSPFEEISQKAIIDYLLHIKSNLQRGHPQSDPRSFLFVFSLSKEKDLLSQWRGYCPNGGYSIGFETLKLKEILQKYEAKISLNGCFYEDQSKKAHSISKVKSLTNNYVSKMTYLTEEQVKDFTNELYYHPVNELLFMCGIFKHQSFYEEKEYRIIANGYKDEWINYRVSENIIVPYIEVEMDTSIISEIVIGPTNNPRTKKSLETFLNQIGKLNKIEITESASTLT